jgi:hypothetical protein
VPMVSTNAITKMITTIGSPFTLSAPAMSS